MCRERSFERQMGCATSHDEADRVDSRQILSAGKNHRAPRSSKVFVRPVGYLCAVELINLQRQIDAVSYRRNGATHIELWLEALAEFSPDPIPPSPQLTSTNPFRKDSDSSRSGLGIERMDASSFDAKFDCSELEEDESAWASLSQRVASFSR